MSLLSRDSGIVPGKTRLLVRKRRDFVSRSQIHFPGPADFLSRFKFCDDCPSLVQGSNQKIKISPIETLGQFRVFIPRDYDKRQCAQEDCFIKI